MSDKFKYKVEPAGSISQHVTELYGYNLTTSNIHRSLKMLEDYINRETAENESDRDVQHRCRDERYILDMAYEELKDMQEDTRWR